jgi:tRNA-splicing ligase RtcB (3'-phosphate/5'-hydroxy nucleic acid ligase)
VNPRQIRKLGVPDDCIGEAIAVIQALRADRKIRKAEIQQKLEAVVESPGDYVTDEVLAPLALACLADREFQRAEPAGYKTWGAESIDQAAHAQMAQACEVPVATRGALMPDAHVGYGLPIGGVLACDNAVIPYAVGVDIGCRMKLSILDLPVEQLTQDRDKFEHTLATNTRFGIGAAFERPQSHEVMDMDWEVTRITRMHKDRAWTQLGTSGSGNHFVEFGVVSITEKDATSLPLEPGSYVGLLSHSGSRGAGAAVCSTYSNIARSHLPRKYEDLAYLAWLDLDSEEGQEYWQAMQLMGHFAAANHDVIHRLVLRPLGARVLQVVENFHNFAWREVHDGKQCIVHRKGATPAAVGQLGIIPGSMADPAFIVRGLGNAESLSSASHGAGRRMSRRAAKDKYSWHAVRGDLQRRGVHVISAGADEVPGVYKDIVEVMSHQVDLVESIGRFDPKIVKMCGDGSKAED